MSEIKYIFAAAAVSVCMIFAGCSAKNNKPDVDVSSVDMTEASVETEEAVTEPLVTLTKETTTTTSTATTVEVETTVTTETATGYVAATDYRTFEGTGLDGEAGSAHNAKPVSNADLYITVAEVGVMPGYTLDWTGSSPWSPARRRGSHRSRRGAGRHRESAARGGRICRHRPPARPGELCRVPRP